MEAMGGDHLPPDLTAPSVVHRVPAKFGYSEVHVPAPGFAEHVRRTEDASIFLFIWMYPMPRAAFHMEITLAPSRAVEKLIMDNI